MVRRDAQHFAADVDAIDGVDVEAVEQRRGRRHAGFFVPQRPDAAVDDRGGRRLAQVVTHRAEHHRDLPGARQVVDAGAGLVDHHQRVDPDVAFGVPLGFLRAADQGQQFREQACDDLEVERERQPQRGGGGAHAAASRSRPRYARPEGRRAECRRAAPGSPGRPEARIVRQTARRAGRAGCRRRSAPDRRRAGACASRSARPANGSLCSPVRGSRPMALMVKSRRRAASANDMRGSPSTEKPRCPRPVFDSRRGSATSTAADLVHRKALAHRLDPPEAREQRRQVRRGDAEDLEIEILGVEAEQPVAHEPAHDPGAATGLGDRRRNRARRFEGLVVRCHALMLPRLRLRLRRGRRS